MATRHRIPTIFNLSMVDVLCCALGCVILLWLLNLREARQRADAAGETSALLDSTRSNLDQSAREADQLRAELARAAREAADARRETQANAEQLRLARDDLNTARRKVADLDGELDSLQAKADDLQERLAKKTRGSKELEKELAAARRRVTDLEVLVRDKEMVARASARVADELAERLRDLDAQVKRIRDKAEVIPGLREEARAAQDKAAAAEARLAAIEKQVNDRARDLAGASKVMKELEESHRKQAQELAARTKELAGATKRIETLEAEKKTLAVQAGRAKAATEDRFAGITLTGRRVVFLVDMSGSMELVDENTPAPQKWSGVRESVAKIMHSLPDLEKFQIILFSNRIMFLLGQENRWLDFDAQTSIGKGTKALALVKPNGSTDMYAAFEAAFRFRPLGLDTIYLLSDGLPNAGAGLTTEQAQNLKEVEKGEILGKYVRKTLKTDWNRPTLSQPRVRINAVGFFYESPDVGAFLWALARENDGSFVGMSKP